MKRTILFFAAFTIVACKGNSGSMSENKLTDEQQAVYNFMAENGLKIDSVQTWKEPDSIFSAYNAMMAFDLFQSRYTTEISLLENELRLAGSSAERKAINDSLRNVKKASLELDSDYLRTIKQKQKNRKAIYCAYWSEGEKYCLYFVFNENGQEIGHMVDDFGNVYYFTNGVLRKRAEIF